MMNDSTTLTILSTAIRQDAEGRYCLNDCHKASGGEPNKAPSEWVKNKQTKALAEELKQSGDSPSDGFQPLKSNNGGANPGTYASEEMVLAYAMWISAKFHAECLRSLLAMMKGQVPQPSATIKSPDHINQLRKASALHGSALTFNKRQGMDLTQARLKALATVKAQTGIDLAKEFGWQPQPLEVQEQTLTATQIGAMLGGMKAQDVNKLLEERGLHTSGRDVKGRKVWLPTPVGRAFGRYEDKAKAHSSGTVQPWGWYPSVVERLRGFTKAPAITA